MPDLSLLFVGEFGYLDRGFLIAIALCVCQWLWMGLWLGLWSRTAPYHLPFFIHKREASGGGQWVLGCGCMAVCIGRNKRLTPKKPLCQRRSGLYKSLEAGYARQFICSTHEMYLVDVSAGLRTSAHAQNRWAWLPSRGSGTGNLEPEARTEARERKLAKRSDKCQDCITFVCWVVLLWRCSAPLPWPRGTVIHN